MTVIYAGCNPPKCCTPFEKSRTSLCTFPNRRESRCLGFPCWYYYRNLIYIKQKKESEEVGLASYYRVKWSQPNNMSRCAAGMNAVKWESLLSRLTATCRKRVNIKKTKIMRTSHTLRRIVIVWCGTDSVHCGECRRMEHVEREFHFIRDLSYQTSWIKALPAWWERKVSTAFFFSFLKKGMTSSLLFFFFF